MPLQTVETLFKGRLYISIQKKVELQDVSMRHISAIAQAFLNGLHFSNKSWWEAFFVGYLPHV